MSAIKSQMPNLDNVSSPSMDSKTIHGDADTLFNKPAKLDNIKYTAELKKVSRDLTHKLYTHIMSCQIALPLGLSLSDSFVSEAEKARRRLAFDVSPDVLYAITEHSMGKFCQKMLTWLEPEPTDETRNQEEVPGVSTEVKEVINEVSTLTEDINPKSPTSSNSQEMTDSDGLNVGLHVDTPTSQNVPQQDPTPQTVPEQTQNVSPPKTEASSSNQASPTKKSSEGLSTPTSDASRDSLTANLIGNVFMQLFLKIPMQFRVGIPAPELNPRVKHLAARAQGEVTVPLSACGKESINKIIKAVIKDLLWDYGTPRKLLEAAISANEPGFDEAFVKYFKLYVNMYLDPPPKKSKLVIFCSDVGRILAKPFRMCINRAPKISPMIPTKT
ncbi:uncharacterized protein LOC121882773 [Scomber scombrus]|uniref:Uncharacterized protein LOC121882773 n=1 Tax=Scomber scombrus TaxID=13677 RepID=A0AAV1Q952_SCOSC